MGIRSRRRIRTPAIEPPSRRRRLESGRKGDVHRHDLPWSAERRDWAALPRDVLWVILSLVPQADVLRGAGLACASWRRLALHEPLLWRRIDLAAADEDRDDDDARRQAMARAAVRRSAGRCESFRGPADGDFLVFLARRAPSLRRLHVTSLFNTPHEKFMTVLAKLPLLEELVLAEGLIGRASLAALVDHCPRLQLLHADGCSNWCPIGRTVRARVKSRIRISGCRAWPADAEDCGCSRGRFIPLRRTFGSAPKNLSGCDDYKAFFLSLLKTQKQFATE